MHSSNILKATDFEYWRLKNECATKCDFSGFCPHYIVQDRVGIVSLCLEDGILNTGYAVLALTTAFYDLMRARGEEFYDYPQHFALLGANDQGIATHAGRLPVDDATIGGVWGGLDVWPDSNWIAAPETASGMLRKVFELQISRLFWPENLRAGQDEVTFPTYVRKLLKARLKTVYTYNAMAPNVEIRVTQSVEDLVRKSSARLPGVEGSAQGPAGARRVEQAADNGFLCVQRYRQVSADQFLQGPQFASMWID
jgi:hypothetical protein